MVNFVLFDLYLNKKQPLEEMKKSRFPVPVPGDSALVYLGQRRGLWIVEGNLSTTFYVRPGLGSPVWAKDLEGRQDLPKM